MYRNNKRGRTAEDDAYGDHLRNNPHYDSPAATVRGPDGSKQQSRNGRGWKQVNAPKSAGHGRFARADRKTLAERRIVSARRTSKVGEHSRHIHALNATFKGWIEKQVCLCMSASVRPHINLSSFPFCLFLTDLRSLMCTPYMLISWFIVSQ